MTINAIRKKLRALFGLRNYAVRQNGDIHAKGKIPNTSIEGWYYYGNINERATIEKLDAA